MFVKRIVSSVFLLAVDSGYMASTEAIATKLNVNRFISLLLRQYAAVVIQTQVSYSIYVIVMTEIEINKSSVQFCADWFFIVPDQTPLLHPWNLGFPVWIFPSSWIRFIIIIIIYINLPFLLDCLSHITIPLLPL